MRREFLQLAHDYNNHSIAGWMVSEKFDGTRAFWDGGVTRGMIVEDVPWANIEKNGRYINRIYATGMWSRYGNVIHAPGWLLDSLPNYPLDGELTAGRGRFQLTRSITSRLEPTEEWRNIEYQIFDAPNYQMVFKDGTINNPNFRKELRGCIEWYENRVGGICLPGPFHSFESTYKFLSHELVGNNNVQLAVQEQLPFTTQAAIERLHGIYNNVLDEGGEGVIIRRHMSIWEPKRTAECLKFKPTKDDEAIVVGYVWGRETNKGSKLLGMMGALVVDYGGVIFELSGFTDYERRVYSNEAGISVVEWGRRNAGKRIDINLFECPEFPLGSRITFRYRELSDTGVPREAHYYRKYNG